MPTTRQRIESIADQVIALCVKGTWSDPNGLGQSYLGPSYTAYSGSSYILDYSYGALARPTTIGANVLYGAISEWASTQAGNGRIFDALQIDGTPIVDGADPSPSRMQIWSDVAGFISAIWSHWKLTGTLRAYNAFKTNAVNALASIPIVSGLWKSDGSSPCWEWEDSVMCTGYPAQSVEMWWAFQQMGQLATSAGDTDEWTSQLDGLKSAIISNLWNNSRGLLWSSSELGGKWNDGSDHTGASGLHNVPLTSLAVWLGIIDGTNATVARIAIRSGLVGGGEYIAGRGHERHGFIRYYPLPEEQLSWRMGEGGSAFGDDNNFYINGNWAVFTSWIALAIKPDFPTEADALMTRLADYVNDDPINGVPETVSAITGLPGGGANATGFFGGGVTPAMYYAGQSEPITMSNPWSPPTPPTTDLVAWLTAENYDGSATWTDVSPAANNWTVANGAPSLQIDQQYGRPIVRFVSLTVDWFTPTTPITLTNFTASIVSRVTGTLGLWLMRTNVNDQLLGVKPVTGQNCLVYYDPTLGAGSVASTPLNPAEDQFSILTVVLSAGIVTLYQNGVVIGTGTGANDGSIVFDALGALLTLYGSDGDVGEVLVYSSDQSANLPKINTYLGMRWNLPTITSAGQPPISVIPLLTSDNKLILLQG